MLVCWNNKPQILIFQGKKALKMHYKPVLYCSSKFEIISFQTKKVLKKKLSVLYNENSQNFKIFLIYLKHDKSDYKRRGNVS